MIYRLLLLFLIVWFLIWIIKKQFINANREPPKLDDQQTEDMVACAHCGTHVPQSLAIKVQDKYYCSEQHSEMDEQ